MKQELKQAVREHYQQQSLDADQLAALENLYRPLAQAPRPAHYLRPRTLLVGLAASLLVVTVSLLLFWQPISNEQRIMAIAAEVAKEHLHQNPLEVSSSNFSSVQQYFGKLDFLPNPSRHFGHGQDLLGGRYCSIQSVTAAQIRYRLPGYPATLYQVAYDPAHFGKIPDLDKGETPLTRHVKGVEIQLWVEKGLLMVAAQNASG